VRTTAIAFFSIAALLSAWLTPNNLPLVTIFFISVPRAIALFIALMLWLASGRLDAWGSSRLAPALMTMAGVATLSFGCFLIQTARDDGLPAPVPMLYRVALALLPVA
jgi:hypothetical protein